MSYFLISKIEKPKKDYRLYWFLAILLASKLIILPFPYLRFLMDILFNITLLAFSILCIFIFVHIFSEEYLLGKRITSALIISILLFSSGYLIVKTLPLVPDIPNWVISKHKYVEGYPVNIKKNYSSKITYQKFSINGINFEVSPAKAFEEIGTSKHRVTYLPHSKYVINIEYIGDK